MKSHKLIALILVAPLILINTPAIADDGSEFVAAFAAAVNGKDRKAWEAFLSSASRTCLAGPGGSMLDRTFAIDTRKHVAPDSKVWVTTLGAQDELIGQGMLAYADRPTHYFQIDLGPPGRSTTSLIRYGRKQGAHWEYIVGCPTAEGLARMKEAEAARALAEKESLARMKSLPPTVAAQARKLVTEGHTIAAAKLIAKETNTDLTTAYGIARALNNKP